jgi:hypothetical protein
MVGVRGNAKDVAKDVAMEAAAARNQARASGYGFTEVKLLKARFDGMLGGDVLHYTRRVDHVSGVGSYNISVSGGAMRFVLDPARDGRFHVMIMTEHNKKFLKTLVADGIVEVVELPAMMSNEEYIAKLNEARVAEGRTPIVGTVDAADPPAVAPVASVPGPAVRKASAPPPVASPLVRIEE